MDVTGSLLDGLDLEQRAAAEITHGPLPIIAGSGTGKTRTLTHRIAHLSAGFLSVPPHNMGLAGWRPPRRPADADAKLSAGTVVKGNRSG